MMRMRRGWRVGGMAALATMIVGAGLTLGHGAAGFRPEPSPAVTKKAKKHRRARPMPFKDGRDFIITIASSDGSNFDKATYATNKVSCVYTESVLNQTATWPCKQAKRHPTDPKRLILVFEAHDIPSTICAEPQDAPQKKDAESFGSTGGTLTITVTEDNGDTSETEAGPTFDILVEPVDVDPCQ